MPPPRKSGWQSKSTPNLSTLLALATVEDHASTTANATSTALPTEPTASPELVTSPPEPASIDEYSFDSSHEPSSLSPPSGDEEEEDEEEDGEEEDGEDDSEEEDVPVPLPPGPLYQHHSRSHTYLAPYAFAPPFYNRPPTPLPPSPSLTSLLRPTFSSHNSGPTTPDPSSDEGPPHARPGTGTGTGTTTGTTGTSAGTGAQTPNSAAASTLTSSFRTAKPIPRASPKVPTYEYYGFTLYLTSSLVFVVYLLWAFLPSPFLHSLGIYYYPNRWWALAIPAWTVMLVVYIYAALAGYNTCYLTLPLGDVECLVDEAANVAVVGSDGVIIRDSRPSWRSASSEGRQQQRHGAQGKKGGKGKRGGHSRQSSLTKAHQLSEELDWRDLWNEGTDAVMDIPIGGVCEILYGGRQDGDGYVDGDDVE